MAECVGTADIMRETLLESKEKANELFEGTNPLKDSRNGCFKRILFSWATPLVKVLLLFG